MADLWVIMCHTAQLLKPLERKVLLSVVWNVWRRLFSCEHQTITKEDYVEHKKIFFNIGELQKHTLTPCVRCDMNVWLGESGSWCRAPDWSCPTLWVSGGCSVPGHRLVPSATGVLTPQMFHFIPKWQTLWLIVYFNLNSCIQLFDFLALLPSACRYPQTAGSWGNSLCLGFSQWFRLEKLYFHFTD